MRREEAGHGVVGDESESAETKRWAARERKEKDGMSCGPYSDMEKRIGPSLGLFVWTSRERKTSHPLNEKQKEFECICLNFHDLTCA
jgi:hypothetical protein